MKKTALILLILTALLLVSCNNGKKQTVRVEINNEEKPELVEVTDLDVVGFGDDVDINFLDEIEGFWVRPEGIEAEDGDSLAGVTEMLVVSFDKSWTPYYDGVAGQVLACSADVDGLHLSDVEGEMLVSLSYDGVSLYDNSGKLLFVRRMSVEERLAFEKDAQNR